MRTTNHSALLSFLLCATTGGLLTTSTPSGAAEPPYSQTIVPNSTCGDGTLDAFEVCDDGNLVDDDGCDASCQPSGVDSLSLGDGTVCALTHAGNVKCWGHNEEGQLGRGDTVSVSESEVAESGFIDLGGRAHAVETNGRQTYALLDTGVVRAWGINDAGQLGLMHTETIGDDETPAGAGVAVDLALGGFVEQVAAGGDFACALLDSGVIQCWGANDFGQLGHGHTERIGDDEPPASLGVALGEAAVSVVAGARHACALTIDGSVRCWGANDAGQLGAPGVDAIGDDEHPASWSSVALGGLAVELVAGDLHTCAVLVDGSVRCWGANDLGQLGQGNSDPTVGVVEVPLVGTVEAIAAGAGRTCALVDEGLVCWGAGGLTQAETVSPFFVVSMGSGTSSVCVQRDDGAVLCDGDLSTEVENSSGETGDLHVVIVDDDSDV